MDTWQIFSILSIVTHGNTDNPDRIFRNYDVTKAVTRQKTVATKLRRDKTTTGQNCDVLNPQRANTV